MKTIILRIGRRGQGEDAGYPVTIHCDEAGNGWDSTPLARAMIPRKLDGLVPENLLGPSGATRDAVLKVARQAVKQNAVQKLGEDLFRLLLRDEIGTHWRRLRNLYKNEKPDKGEQGRRVLLDIRDPELRRLPWELLREPGSPIWLAGDGLNTLARVSPWPDSPGEPVLADTSDEPPRYRHDQVAPDANGPLRVLVVVGSEAKDPRVDAERELRAIEKALWGLAATNDTEAVARCCRFDLQVLRQPLPEDLARKYNEYRPHVFHFIGHGAIDDSGTTKLILWTPTGDEEFTIDKVFLLIGQHAPELAVLNCCHANAEPWQGGVWSIAKVFLDRGTGAVLGTLGPVPGSTAAEMAGAFYDQLAEGQAIDLALTLALQKVGLDRLPAFGAASPYLQLGVPPDQVLSMPPPDRVQRVSRVSEFRGNLRFVNRYKERAAIQAAAIVRAIGRAPGVPTPSRVVVLKGSPGVGKTWLLCKAMECCALAARRLKYVKLADRGAVDFLGLVLAIRKAKTISSANEPPGANPNPFAELDQTIQALPLAEGPSFGQGDYRKMIGPKADDNANDRIAAQLLAGLKAIADPIGLILVLDQLTNENDEGLIPPEFKSLAIPKLIQPILEGHVTGVTLVIASKADEIKPLGLASLDPVPDTFDLEPFPDKTFREYAEEYCRRKKYPWVIAERTISKFEEDFSGPWSPSELDLIDRVVSRRLPPGGPK